MNTLNPHESSLDFLSGGGEMAGLIRNFDWSSTALGPMELWPQSLKTATGIMVQSPIPIVMLWGEDGIMIYNDSYSVFAGGRHPQLLGSKVLEGWPEVADFNRNVMETGLAGKTLSYKDTPLILNRKGTGEEVALDLNYSPIMGENGKPAGVLSIVVETTQRVRNERALATLREIGSIDFKEKSLDLIYENVANILGNNEKDFPFVKVYTIGKDKKSAQAIASTGIEIGHPYFPDWVDLKNTEEQSAEFLEAFLQNQVVIGEIKLEPNNLPKGIWDIPPKRFAQIPVGAAGNKHPNAIISVALNPYREVDEDYLQFCQLISERVSSEVNKMLAIEEESKKAEALAAIDLTKPAFFKNNSHKTNLFFGHKEEEKFSETFSSLTSSVLIVDDNADMREHLRSLLQDRYSIATANHGKEALEKIKENIPDLVLSDVMMPVMDGINLLKAIKSNPDTEHIPVILLTARAGEESRIEGLEIGADDYLIKPFSAKELIARINSQLKIGEAKKRIAESEKSLQSFFQNIPAAIAILKVPEQVYTLANSRYLELVNRSEEQLLGKSVLEVFPEVEGQGIFEMVNSVYLSQKPFSTSEYPATFLRGGKMTTGIFNIVLQPVKNQHGEVSELIVHAVEITELIENRKKIEANETILNGQKKALEQTFRGEPLREVLKTLVLTAEKQAEKPLRASILLMDEEGKHLLHGAAPSLPQAYNDAIHGVAIGPKVGSCGTAAFTRKEVLVENIEIDPLWEDFKDLALSHGLRSCWSTPVFSSQGHLLGTFAVYYPEPCLPSERDKKVIELLTTTARIVIEWYQDIELRQKTEAQLIASENQFRIFADHIQNLAWIADGEGWIHWYNQRWYEYTGTTLEKMEGWGWEKVHHPDHIDRVVNFVRDAWKKDEPWQLIFPLRRHDGEYRTFLTRAYPVKDSSGKIERWIGTNTDIEDQRKFAEELERKVKERTAELQQQNEELASFTYIASHDLQEPLRKIQSFISRLMDRYSEEFSESSKDYFARISKSASRMQNLIQALLNYSRTNKKEKIFVESDLNSLLEEAKMELNVMIEETGTQIESDPLPVLPVIPIQMVQLFSNILSNAIKYRKVGVSPQIKISAEQIDASEIQSIQSLDYKTYWKLSFADNGIGFEQQFSSKIFELFQRLHGKLEYSGTGIGLAICKKIAENHFGLIQAEGELDQGATFHLYLPIKS